MRNCENKNKLNIINQSPKRKTPTPTKNTPKCIRISKKLKNVIENNNINELKDQITKLSQQNLESKDYIKKVKVERDEIQNKYNNLKNKRVNDVTEFSDLIKKKKDHHIKKIEDLKKILKELQKQMKHERKVHENEITELLQQTAADLSFCSESNDIKELFLNYKLEIIELKRENDWYLNKYWEITHEKLTPPSKKIK